MEKPIVIQLYQFIANYTAYRLLFRGKHLSSTLRKTTHNPYVPALKSGQTKSLTNSDNIDYPGLVRAKFETLDFTGGGFWQLHRELKPAWIFVRRESCFTVLQQFSRRFFRSIR